MVYDTGRYCTDPDPFKSGSLDALFDVPLKRGTDLIRRLTGEAQLVVDGVNAAIYKVTDDEGRVYALKSLNPEIGSQDILRNLLSSRCLTDHLPFVKTRAIPDPRYGHWYIMDWQEGDCFELLIEQEDIHRWPSMVADALLTYAQMLKFAHSKGFCYVDPNWGSLITNWRQSPGNHQTRVVDYDMMEKTNRINASRLTGRPFFFSKSEICEMPKSPKTETVSFAYMIDELFNEQAWRMQRAMEEYSGDIQLVHIINVAMSRKKVPQKRQRNVPEHLRPLVYDLIDKDVDSRVTMDAVIEAILRDYPMLRFGEQYGR